MGGNLVIVESPAKAKTIQKFLGEDYTVKSSFGHIRDLQNNKLSIDIDRGFAPEYIVPSDKKKVVGELQKLAQGATAVWLASDEDREGEAISWHLAQTLGLDATKAKRIVFHEITKDAILNAIRNPRTIDMNLVNAQQARRVLDRLVGFELSPVLWKKIQPKLSAGRVQSVALRLVVDREKEIMAFKNEAFYKVEAVFCSSANGVDFTVKAALDTKFSTLEQARAFLEDCAGAKFEVSSIDSKESLRFPSAPFTTSTLQQEAAHKLHFPVSTTMRVAQTLYERGLITYMRTDSTNLSTLALGTAKQYIVDNFGAEFSHTRQYKTHSKGAQEAHEAIRPTFIGNTSIEGTAQEQSLYSLIWRRTVASQMQEAKVMNTNIQVSIENRNEKFSIHATNILFEGFMKVYKESSEDGNGEDDVILPEMHIGDVLTAQSISALNKYTQAPYRYSEATLVKKLEELGIGRPSTYAPTISTLTTGRGYLIKGDKEGRKLPATDLKLVKGKITESSHDCIVGAEKGKLLPQDIGMIVTDYLVKNFSDILDYDFTANVEKNFDQIADGEMVWNDAISEFYSPFHEKVSEALNNKEYNRVSREIGTAPDGEVLIAKFGKFGPYIQKGDPQKRQFANLGKGQLIEDITVEQALKLFELPRVVGQKEGIDVIVTKGRFGPYIKYQDRNISLPRGADPLKISLEECCSVIDNADSATPQKTAVKEFPESGISVFNGQYGPYLKFDGSNYKVPKGTDIEALTEDICKKIISEGQPASKARRFYKKR